MSLEHLKLKKIEIPTPQQAIEILGGRLPSVLKDNRFEHGLIVEGERYYVPAYVASPLGFDALGRYARDHYLYPQLKEAGIFPLCPFQACGEYMVPSAMFDTSRSLEGHQQSWSSFDRKVLAAVNYGLLLPHSLLTIAILEGPHADEGVASELTYTNHLGLPAVGVRSDFRLGENVGSPTNPAVDDFIAPELLFTGPQAYEHMFAFLHGASAELIAQQLVKPK